MERDNVEDPGGNEKILQWIFKMWDGVVQIGLIWLRIWTCGGYLLMR